MQGLPAGGYSHLAVGELRVKLGFSPGDILRMQCLGIFDGLDPRHRQMRSIFRAVLAQLRENLPNDEIVGVGSVQSHHRNIVYRLEQAVELRLAERIAVDVLAVDPFAVITIGVAVNCRTGR
ncbi:hypothetical protein [Sinorhizobium medicae]|uniref:hypothetical protein n=1 Tax=Sinorhizobium medicae TaxID=110321 RepID=UPI001F465CB2|nr:hypothetical protein [Sinorhizobium medicae]